MGSAAPFSAASSGAMSKDSATSVALREPFDRFVELLAVATKVGPERLPEPTAFALATVGSDGQPSVRILLLKLVDVRGFAFYTNYESRKGEELISHPQAAMCFHWQPLERQVRVEGIAEQVSAEEADAYFASRPRESQLGAWASRQSQPMEHPGALDERFREFESRFANGPVPRPPHWSGFRIVPKRIEFWHQGPSRLHDRLVYTREGDGWRTEVLYP